MTQKEYERWKRSIEFCEKVFHCHQMAERSFFFRGVQFPVCARCTGLILGFFILGPVISVFTLGNMYLSLFFIFIMCTDGLLQLKGQLISNNRRRVITGLIAGYAFFSIVLHVIFKIVFLIK